MMAARGHEVEVFTSAPVDSLALPAGVVVHAASVEWHHFPRAVASLFARRHIARPFDVIEGPDFGAQAMEVSRSFPDLPLVVKLHTPTFLIDEIGHTYLSRARKARFVLGGLRRGRLPSPYWRYDPAGDPEREHALAASEITAPSRAILELVRCRWNSGAGRLVHIPNVFDFTGRPPDPSSRDEDGPNHLPGKDRGAERCDRARQGDEARPDPRPRHEVPPGRPLPSSSGDERRPRRVHATGTGAFCRRRRVHRWTSAFRGGARAG